MSSTTAPGTDLERGAVAKLIADAGGSFLKAYRNLVKGSAKEVARTTRTTVASRKAELRTALAEYDVDQLVELSTKMAGIIDAMTATDLMEGEPRTLTALEKVDLMGRYLTEREATELLAVSKDIIREKVFDHITMSAKAAGEEDPDQVNGHVDVPELGFRFCREGCGPKDPTLRIESDEDGPGLRQLLGEERWAKVTETIDVPEQVIEAHTETVLSEELLMRMAAADPAILADIKAALAHGGWKTPRFVVRPITDT
jgi:hypothetical protein